MIYCPSQVTHQSFTTSQCAKVREVSNWLSLLIAKEMLGLVIVKYSRAPIVLQYKSGLSAASPIEVVNGLLAIIAEGKQVPSCILVSRSKSLVYLV